MKAKSIISILSTTALVAITIAGCADAGKGAAATKVEALDAAAWNQSKWISSAAPLVFPEENEDKAANYADLEAHEGRILARYKTPSGDIYITMEFYEEPPVVMLMFRDEY